MSSRNALADEIEVLKSIYDDDLKYDGSTIVITLYPLQEKDKKNIFAHVDLNVVCSDMYPKKGPNLELKNVKGLSNNSVQVLYEKLQNMAKSMLGEVMIYNLAYCVQEFLSENYVPGRKSCYEEMLFRKERQKQEEYESEIYKKTKLIKDIKEKQKEMLQSTENDSSDCEDDEEKFKISKCLNRKTSKILEEDMPCEHRNCKYIQFNNKVLRGCCIEHGTNSILYCAIDSTTGDQLLLHEWTLKPKNKNLENVGIIESKLQIIQNDLVNLKKLCHENLISYIDFKWFFEKSEWTVHLLQECITGVNLNVLFEQNSHLDVNFIKYVIYGILNAIQYLHSHGIVHGCLSGSSIYFTKLGIIKLADYGIKQKIDNLNYFCKYEDLKVLNDTISPKSDILEIGNLLLQIVKLSSIPNKNDLIPDIPPEMKEFLEKCLIENEEGRWTARQLLNHKFLKIKESKQNVLRKKSGGDDLDINVIEIEKPYDVFFDEHQSLNSRLAKEFKILNHIGSGSFGKVLKVKNKLDGSVYAIKAIRLNMNNKQLGKKIIREVKLLSKLNHENVVRYYTSWVEADINLEDNSLNQGIDDVDSKPSYKFKKSNLLHESEDENDDEDDEEDEEEDELDSSSKNFRSEKKDQSSYIVFENDSLMKNMENTRESNFSASKHTDELFKTNRTMYIQMEFCEKSTLRLAINDTTSTKLCDDESRLWRLFREIVEGLAYVHEQGMIHRDLKPENIFLDSSDHVKIGDFGLATISAVSKSFLAFIGASSGGGDNDAFQNIYDGCHTGKVGTSLYVAPEVDKTFEKSYYNEKVDIYSLGIIFFEMCNGPFNTDMERIETIVNLRKFDVIFPFYWEEKLCAQKRLVKKLLNHDPKSRPYCSEILEGNYLPPAEFEYEQFQDIMRQTLTNPKSKAYKYLVSSCFDQEVSIEDDITYEWENARSEKQHFILDLVKDRMESILKKHGAIYLSAPLLLPQNKEYKNIEFIVKLMTHSGSIVNLPYDLRISFARYAAFKAFTRLRRYVVERVYREKKVHGLHPKEQYECAFDLITPPSGIENAQLEVFSIVQEIINDFKSLKNRNCVLRLNHSFLLRAVLIHFNSEKWFTNIFKILVDAKDNKHFKSKLELSLHQLGIQSANVLFNLLTREDSFSSMKKEMLLLITKRGKASDVLNRALDQLHTIIEKAQSSGINVPIRIAMSVVCSSEHCSDIMFDVAYLLKQKKKKEETIVLMSGCRYDGLIAKFRRLFELANANSDNEVPSAVGLSVYLDKIAAILKEDNILSDYVVIWAFGNNVITKAKDAMAKKLWESGIKCYIEETIQTLEELTDYCRENNIIHIINLKDEETGVVYVMTWDNDKNHYQEKKISVRDVIDYILKFTKSSEGQSSPLYSRQTSEFSNRITGNELINGNLNIHFHIIYEEKLGFPSRKKWDSHLRSRVSSISALFSSRTRLEIVGVFLDQQKIREVAANFKPDDTFNSYVADIDYITDRNSLKKYVTKICLKLKNLLSENSNTLIVLYSLLQDKYQLLHDS